MIVERCGTCGMIMSEVETLDDLEFKSDRMCLDCIGRWFPGFLRLLATWKKALEDLVESHQQVIITYAYVAENESLAEYLTKITRMAGF